MGRFDDLPYDCLVDMLPYVSDYRSLTWISMCNRILNEIGQSDELWQVQSRKFLPENRYTDQLCRTLALADANWCGWRRFFINVKTETKAQHIAQLFVASSSGGGDSHDFITKAKDTIGKMLDVRLSTGGCIGTRGGTLLAKVLTSNACLQTLDLHGQLLRVDGMSALSGALRGCSSLRCLVLSENKLGPEGARHVAALIQGTSGTLQSLDLRGNFFGAEGCTTILSAYSVKGKSVLGLKKLYMDNNGMGDAIGAKFVSTFYGGSSSTLLDALYLRDNSLGKATATEVVKCIKALSPPPPPPPKDPKKRHAPQPPPLKILNVSNNNQTRKETINGFPAAFSDVVVEAKVKGIQLDIPKVAGGGEGKDKDCCVS